MTCNDGLCKHFEFAVSGEERVDVVDTSHMSLFNDLRYHTWSAHDDAMTSIVW